MCVFVEGRAGQGSRRRGGGGGGLLQVVWLSDVLVFVVVPVALTDRYIHTLDGCALVSFREVDFVVGCTMRVDRPI